MVFTAKMRRNTFGDNDYLFGDWSKLSDNEKWKRRAVGVGTIAGSGYLGHMIPQRPI